MSRQVLGLIGPPGSGKDSCAEALASHGFISIAFADELRQEVAAAWRVDVRMLTDRATKEVPLPALAIGMCGDPRFLHWAAFHGLSYYDPRSPRWVLQRWGSDFRRGQDPDYWVRIAERWCRRQLGLCFDRIVITDVRMANEADMVRRLDGRLVRVERPDVPAMAADTAGHSSEAHAALAVDGVIRNDGPLVALADEVDRVLGQLFGVSSDAGSIVAADGRALA